MNIRSIITDYPSYLYKTYDRISYGTIKPHYFIINGDEMVYSTTPYASEDAELVFVIYGYVYTVISKTDYNFFTLFVDRNGRAEDFIEIDGWSLSFSEPITHGLCSYNKYVYIRKNDLELMIKIPFFKCHEYIPSIWNLYKQARECSSQRELDMLRDLYTKDQELKDITHKCLYEQARSLRLESKIEEYKDLLDLIKKMANDSQTLRNIRYVINNEEIDNNNESTITKE